MLVIRQKMIYRSDIQSNRNIMYVFGDNLDRLGMGGQAKEMRGEPNSFGIATKKSISHSFPDDYFFDTKDGKLNPAVEAIIDGEFLRLAEKLAPYETTDFGRRRIYKYKAVIIPADGIGTGLSKMPEYAPKALEYIEKKFKQLEKL